MTPSKACYLTALVLFIIATILSFASTNVSPDHILGFAFAGLAFLAVAPVSA